MWALSKESQNEISRLKAPSDSKLGTEMPSSSGKKTVRKHDVLFYFL